MTRARSGSGHIQRLDCDLGGLRVAPRAQRGVGRTGWQRRRVLGVAQFDGEVGVFQGFRIAPTCLNTCPPAFAMTNGLAGASSMALRVLGQRIAQLSSPPQVDCAIVVRYLHHCPPARARPQLWVSASIRLPRRSLTFARKRGQRAMLGPGPAPVAPPARRRNSSQWVADRVLPANLLWAFATPA